MEKSAVFPRQLNILKAKRYRHIPAWISFAVILIFYAITSCRTVPPYRDSGELITAACTLSIAHSPGYPVYIILGKLFITLGGLFGINPAWSMNLFSGIAGAFAVFFTVLLLFELTRNNWVSVFGGLLTGFSYMNWYLSVVSEMYSLNLMFVVLLLYLLRIRKYILFSFIAGLMLGNHLTSLLAVAPMGIYILAVEYGKINWKKIILYFFLGLAVYIYLPVRAQAQPFINWGEPADFTGFWKVVSRAAYGHTLDLVSREVALKQVLIPHLGLFMKSLTSDLSPAGIFFAFAGIFICVKEHERRRWLFNLMLLLIFIMTGPVFLYMARMPVNPHAVAIVEVGYMLPEMILAIFAALGILFILNNLKMKLLRCGFSMLAALLLIFNVFKAYPMVDKSRNYVAEDYALNILNTVAPNAVVVMRRDHTMFSLWYKKDVEGVRSDVKVISKGLLSADWYRNKLKLDHPEINWNEEFISDENYIEWFYKKYAESFPVYLTAASAGELSKDFFQKYTLQPFGLVLKMTSKDTGYDPDEVISLLEENYRLRGPYRTSEYYDFFTRDFITLYARYYNRLGMEYFKMDKAVKARNMYGKAIRLDPFLYKAYSNLAFSFFIEGDNDEAEKNYIKATDLLEKKIKQHTRKKLLVKDLAEMYNNLGAIYEKELRVTKESEYFQKALFSYNRAIELLPEYSQVHYNKGVLYWGRGDWVRVVKNFEAAFKYAPENIEIKEYLMRARKNLRQK